MNKELELINRQIEQLEIKKQKKCEEINKRIEEVKHNITILEARKQKAIDDIDTDEYNSILEQLKRDENSLKMLGMCISRGSPSIDDEQYNLLCDQIIHVLDEEWNRTAAKIMAALAPLPEAAKEYTDNVTHGNEMLHALQYDLRGKTPDPFTKDKEYMPCGRIALDEMIENLLKSPTIAGIKATLKE